MKSVEVFTDGSCHTQLKIGAWAAILLIDNEKIKLCGYEHQTTHNRMELTAVIKSIEHICKNHGDFHSMRIISDSQYVVGLRDRSRKLSSSDFKAKSGSDIQNLDLVKVLISQMDLYIMHFEKIKAHQKKSALVNYNIEADKLCRKIVREQVRLMDKS